MPLQDANPTPSFGGFGVRGVRLYSSPLPHIRWHICYHMFESHILILWMVDGLYFVGSQLSVEFRQHPGATEQR